MPLLIVLIICAGYIMAAPLTSLVSLDLRETEWLNAGTYLFIFGSWVIWAAIVAAFFGFVAWIRGL